MFLRQRVATCHVAVPDIGSSRSISTASVPFIDPNRRVRLSRKGVALLSRLIAQSAGSAPRFITEQLLRRFPVDQFIPELFRKFGLTRDEVVVVSQNNISAVIGSTVRVLSRRMPLPVRLLRVDLFD